MRQSLPLNRRAFYFKIQLALLAASIILPLPVRAVPAVTCHCFKDRAFDPVRPAATDPYFLTTVQNSFFVLVFNVDKKSIVIKKQLGTPSDDLWIACKTGAAPDSLLQSRQKIATWKNTIESINLNTKGLGGKQVLENNRFKTDAY